MKRDTDHDSRPGVGVLRAALAVAAAVALFLARDAVADEQEPQRPYIHAEALLKAREMHAFTADEENVNILLGGFSLTLGERSIAGRDAVMWFKQRRLGQEVFRDIELYVEGGVTIVEADGTTTRDSLAMVLLRQAGELRARVGGHAERDLRELPLYRRAVAERKRAASAATQPVERPIVVIPPLRPGKAVKVVAPTTMPAPYEPVSFSADEVSHRSVPDPSAPDAKRHITIAKGNVYLAQGRAPSDLFVEITADAAVIYTRPDPKAKGEFSQRVIGAYLEGDVVLRRGERSVTGTRMFYDFQSGKALILEPVLRTVQEQRNIPVYIRGSEARQMAAHPPKDPAGPWLRGYEWTFRDALVTTSDFYSPSYDIAARQVRFKDATLYDAEGVAVSERRWQTTLRNTTFDVYSVPVMWWPFLSGDAEEGHTAVRRAQFGRHGRFGWGVETDWFLFRLLGLPRPEGFTGTVGLDWYERGLLAETNVKYDRESYLGYVQASGLLDNRRQDDFGTARKDIDAPPERGRLLWRHKQFLPRDWMIQGEFSYLCDRNYLEQFYPHEFWAEKEQDTLLYARKQGENWAVTILGKWRVNDFQTETESFPDVSGYLIGESLGGDRLTLYSEARAGLLRYRTDTGAPALTPGDTVVRGDTRHEVNYPFGIGPVRVLPFAAGRVTAWDDSPGEGGLARLWGQTGLRATTHLWRVYDGVESRLWDLHRMKHVVTPYGGLFLACTDVEPSRVYPFDPGVEEYVRRLGGSTLGVRQLWQTQRGRAEDRHTVDWLRLDVSGSFFDDAETTLPADGRYFLSRPEYSLPRNAINAEAAWMVSDATTVLADANYDLDSGELALASAGVAISRDPRLRYFVGLRRIEALDSSIGTVGAEYQISRKYRVNVFEQYDFDFRGGQNSSTSVTLTRQFPRWFMGITLVYDRTQNDVGLLVTVWPEGVPEMRIGGRRLSLMGSGASGRP